MDEEQNSVIEEAAPQVQEVENPAEEQAIQTPVEDPQEKNWRAVRQRLANLEKENNDLKTQHQRLIEAQEKARQMPDEPEPEEDEYANYKGVKRTARKEVAPLEKKIENLEQELEKRRQQDLMQSLKSKYPDFDDVVNPETIAILEQSEPELATTIGHLKDPYAIGIQAYKYIKALDLESKVPGKRRQKEAEKKIEKNNQTVPSPQAYDKRPMAQAFKLTEAEKSKLYEEMQSYASMASSVPPMM